MDKNFVWLIITALLGVFVWGGFSIFFAVSKAEINPNASTYTTPIGDTFNMEVINELSSGIEENFPIQPDELRAYAVIGE